MRINIDRKPKCFNDKNIEYNVIKSVSKYNLKREDDDVEVNQKIGIFKKRGL